MPRHKSSLTDGVCFSVRMSKAQREMFNDLGGIDWLRKYIDRQLLQEEIQLRCTETKTSSDSQRINPVSYKPYPTASESQRQP